MIKTEEMDNGHSHGLLYNRNTSSVLPPLPPLSSAPTLHHYSMITPSGSVLSDLNAMQHHHHVQQVHYPPHHRHLETDEKPDITYLNRHLLHNQQIHSQDLMQPPVSPLSASPLNNNTKLETSSGGGGGFDAPPPIHDYATTSTIKYCSSNGLEILPVQPQHAYVIQQCPSSVNRSTESQSHSETQMETNAPHIQHHQMSSVLQNTGSAASANHGNSGGQLEVVQYAGIPSGASSSSQQQQRKKDTASPVSAGERSPSDEHPDTTKKGNNTRRPEKPNMSYINMIACAIKESPDRMLTLNGIYNYLQQK